MRKGGEIQIGMRVGELVEGKCTIPGFDTNL